MLVLDGDVLVSRAFLRERDRWLDGRLPIDLSVGDRVAAEQRIAGCEAMIDATLREVLVGRLPECELQLAHAAAKRSPVGSRKEDIEISRDGWMQLHQTGGEDAAARIVIRHSCETCDAEPFDESFIGNEEERLVASQRPSEDAPELVARDRGTR